MIRQHSSIPAAMRLAAFVFALCPTTTEAQSIQASFPPWVTLEAQQFGGEFTKWVHQWSETDPMVVSFRWSRRLQDAGAAKWEVLNENLAVVATGNAGQAPLIGYYRHFNVDFRPIVGSNPQRPLNYWVRVAVPSALRSQGLPPPPVLSARAKITFLGSAPPVQFTLTGLRPDLLHTLPIAIDLQSIKILDGGDGQEPYLFVVVVYADGSTVVPRLNAAAGRIEFPDSSVRVASAQQTHGNLAGSNSLDEGDIAQIPSSTGHFDTVLRPIGINLASQFNLGSDVQDMLRAATQVGILVIGMEEGSAPSTDVMDQIRAELVSGVQTELDKVVRGITLSAANPKPPDIVSAVQQVSGTLRQRLIASAKAKSMSELLSRLGIPGPPALMGFLGLALAANKDEYVGYDVQMFTYEDILDAGESGIDMTMELSNPDSDLRYRVRGRLRIRLM